MLSKLKLTIFGGDLLTCVQYLAWVDLLLFCVLIGPTIIFFLATKGLSPVLKQETITTKEGTYISTVALYEADRSITEIEFLITERVREGCGREYLRALPPRWAEGRAHFVVAAYMFSIAMGITVVSGILFLVIVPSKGLLGKYMPAVHLLSQIISVASSTIGCWELDDDDLCFLEYVLPSFRIQTGISIITGIICCTYKFYEILVVKTYLISHLQAIREAEALQSSPSQEIEALMNQIKTTADEKEVAAVGAPVPAWDADSDLRSILEGLKNKTTMNMKGYERASVDTSSFSFTPATNTVSESTTLTSSMSERPSITYGPSLVLKPSESLSLLKEDGMTIILPARNSF